MDLSLKKAPMNEDDSNAEQDVFVFPVSFAQQRLWILDQFDPGNPAYNIFSAYRLTGTLDVKAMEDSLNTILQRHEALRTTFSMQDDQPVQVIPPFKPTTLPVTSLEHLSAFEQAAETGLLLEKIARNPFNLSEGPLFQPSLVKLASQDHILVFNMHHIVSDGWSHEVLWQELSALYAALSQGLPNPLPVLPIQYPDFAIWQREILQGDALASQLDFWKKNLADVTTTELPADRPRPAFFTYEGANLSFDLGARLTNGLKEFSRNESATLFMTLLAAFQLLLHRYTGQADVVVGSFSANRNRVELEGLIGFFVNTLVMRTRLDGQASFRRTLREVRKTTLDVYTHQDLPFEKLVEELKPRRDPGRNPFVQTTFILQNTPARAPELAGLKVEPARMKTHFAKFDLSLAVEDTPAGLRLTVNYNTHLFNEDRIQRLGAHYQTLLKSILADPDQPVATLPMLTQAEAERMLMTWNAAEAAYPTDTCLPQLFERWAQQTPAQDAVVLKGQKMTYVELDHQANKIATRLSGLGVKPESRVAVYMDRCPQMIVGILGILKAGGAYVPIEPGLPQERLAYLLQDSGSMLVLSHEKYTHTISALGIPLVSFEEIIQTGASVDETPQVELSPDNLAYIMYTSGSTGKPKGVMISHRNVVGFLYAYKEVTRDGPHRVGTSVAPFNFDTSVEEIFACLCFGGTLHILLPENSTDPRWMAAYLLKERITTSYIISDFLPDIASEIKKLGGDLPLKCLITGLAPKKESVLQPFRELSPKLRILNAYGPTEVTYGSSAYEFIEMQDARHDVPIGLPFPNYRTYIVDANLQPVPVGVAGELLIGGIGLARGYHNRPKLTAEAFIPDPFSGHPGERMYRSGDLARYLPDGNIEFIGRADDQVKVRGYRIELGEIEANLAASPLVQKCVLLAREDQPGDKRLVAYLKPAEGKTPTSSELRDYLSGKLPVYMLPNQFILLDEFPLMSNGKVNRSLLPAPDSTRPALDEAYQPPATANEQTLVDIWCKLLGLERIGIYDNFFELGGHSLLVIRMIEMTKDQLGFELPLSAVFEAPSIHQLGIILDTENWQPRWRSLVAIQSAGEKEPLFLVPPSATTGMKFSSLAKQLGSSQPLYSFNHLGLDGRQEPHRKMEDMAALYVAEMLAFKPQGPYLLGGMCFGNWVVLEMAQQLKKMGHQISLLVFLDPPVIPSRRNKPVSSKKDPVSFILRIFSHIIQGRLLKLVRGYIFKKIRGYKKMRRFTSNIHFTNLCHTEATRSYEPQSYPDRVILIQSDDRKKRGASIWNKILTGKVDYYVIPNSYHLTFLKKGKNIQTVAKLINDHLNDFQPGHTSQETDPNNGDMSDG